MEMKLIFEFMLLLLCVVMIKSFKVSHSLTHWVVVENFHLDFIAIACCFSASLTLSHAEFVDVQQTTIIEWMSLFRYAIKCSLYGLCDKFRLIAREMVNEWIVQLNYCWIMVIIVIILGWRDENKIKRGKKNWQEIGKKRIFIMLHLVSMKNDFFCGQKNKISFFLLQFH